MVGKDVPGKCQLIGCLPDSYRVDTGAAGRRYLPAYRRIFSRTISILVSLTFNTSNS